MSPFGLSLRAARLGHLMESKTRCQGRMEERKAGSICCPRGAGERLPSKTEARPGGPRAVRLSGCRAVGHWACGEHPPNPSFC